MAFSYSKTLIFFILGSAAMIGIESILQIVYAQEIGTSVIRRIEIWALFYRLMIAAFMVGAAVAGVMVYIIVRFRESNKRYKVSGTTTGSRIGGIR